MSLVAKTTTLDLNNELPERTGFLGELETGIGDLRQSGLVSRLHTIAGQP